MAPAHFSQASASTSHVLILDEPTNHLDVEAIEQLERALAAFDGALLMMLLDAIGIAQWRRLTDGAIEHLPS